MEEVGKPLTTLTALTGACVRHPCFGRGSTARHWPVEPRRHHGAPLVRPFGSLTDLPDEVVARDSVGSPRRVLLLRFGAAEVLLGVAVELCLSAASARNRCLSNASVA